VLRFAWYLNGLALVNIDSGGSRSERFAAWIRLTARLAPAGIADLGSGADFDRAFTSWVQTPFADFEREWLERVRAAAGRR
jgi:hypothetical protein